MQIVLRVWRRDFDVDGFLRDHPQLRADTTWHEGETRRRGAPFDDSGFTVAAGDADSFPLSCDEVLRNVRSVNVAVVAAGLTGIGVVIDFPLMIRSGKYTRYVRFSNDFLKEITTLGASLEISGYRTDP